MNYNILIYQYINILMALATISTIHSTIHSTINKEQYTINNFVFPDDVITHPITTNMGYTIAPNETHHYNKIIYDNINFPWKNGEYLMMGTFYRPRPPGRMFNGATSGINYTTSRRNYSNSSFIYDTLENKVISGPTLNSTRRAYGSNGLYVGLNDTTGFVSSNYVHNGSIFTSNGEYFELRFPFTGGFILEKLSFYMDLAHSFGARKLRVIGSNDGVNWELVNSTWVIKNYVRYAFTEVFNIKSMNTRPYKHHRFIFEELFGAEYLSITLAKIEGKAIQGYREEPNKSGMWLVFGGDTNNNTMGYSYDGQNFTGLGTSIFSLIGFRAASSENIIVAVGQGTKTIAYSYNGLDYTPLETNIIGIGLSIAWSSPLNMFVVGGSPGTSGNNFVTSSDGINWTGRGIQIMTTNVRSIVWGNDKFVAGGEGSTNNSSIAYSFDGITWSGVANSRSTLFSARCMDVAFNGTTYVAVGTGTNSIATSSDGFTWTGRGNPVFTRGEAVIWCRGINRWVALGGGGTTPGTDAIAYSDTGTTWTGVTGFTIFTVGKDLSWDGTRLVAVGTGPNHIATSIDGINWVGLGKNIFNNDTIGGNSVKYVELLS